ncbi:hypothetical protein PGB90_007235 [Kerria lacca]
MALKTNLKNSGEELVTGEMEKKIFPNMVRYSICGEGYIPRIICWKLDKNVKRGKSNMASNNKMETKDDSKNVKNININKRSSRRGELRQNSNIVEMVLKLGNKENIQLKRKTTSHDKSNENKTSYRKISSRSIIKPVIAKHRDTSSLQRLMSKNAIIDNLSYEIKPSQDNKRRIRSSESLSLKIDQTNKNKKKEMKNYKMEQRCTRSQSVQMKRVCMRNAIKQLRELKNKNASKKIAIFLFK